MGAENDKKKTNKDLQDLAKVSKPIMPTTSGRTCTIEDGKIVQNVRHYKDDYDSLNLHLEKLKNKMNIIISDDAIEIIQMRFENFKQSAVDEELKTSIDSFSFTYKTNLLNYYNLIGEIKKVYKEAYISIATFLTNWLKVQKQTETNEEVVKIEECEKKCDILKKNFDNFKESEEIIKKVCSFQIDFSSNNKINEINNYFEENRDEIGKYYNFENIAKFRSLINLKEQIIDSINQKNNFVDILNSFLKEYLTLYKKVLSSIDSTNLEKVEIANELNEYNGVVIYHRLIRSIEERIKKIKI
jgi:hypothetical protein